MRRWLSAAICVWAAVFAGAVHAQPAAWPQRPITLLTGGGAGSPTDALARMIAAELESRLGQPVVVENKPGAGSQIATMQAARAKPDGYTLLFSISAHTINAAVRKHPKYDPVADFTPIGLIAAVPHILVIANNVPASNLTELIALAKAEPGRLSYGSSGIGVSNHMEGELLARMAGISLLHVPYKGGTSQVMQDLLGGRVDMLFDVIGNSLPLIAAGRIKPIGVVLPKRTQLAPQIPTIAESGLPGFEAMPWVGLFGPAKLDPAIVDKVDAALQDALADKQVIKKLADYGTEVMAYPPAQFTQFLKGDIQKWTDIARQAKIEVED